MMDIAATIFGAIIAVLLAQMTYEIMMYMRETNKKAKLYKKGTSERKRIKIKLDGKAFVPLKAHSVDAGYDIRSTKDVIITPKGSETIDTGIHIDIPTGYVGLLKSRSGLNIHYGIVCAESVIDSGYTGSIRVKLYNLSESSFPVIRSEKIAQLLILPIMDSYFEMVNDTSEFDYAGERGNNGFGSTGR